MSQKWMRSTLALVLAVALVSLLGLGGLVGCGKEKSEVEELQPTTWKLVHSFPETGTRGMAAAKFKELVEQVTEGKITVDIYPNGTLLSGADAVTGVITGAVDVTFDPQYFWQSRISWISYLYLYGLWQSWQHAYDVFTNPVWKETMTRQYAAVGGHYLGDDVESLAAAAYYNNDEPVYSVMDMKGWKYGIYQGSTPSVSAKYIGYEFVTIPYGEHQSAITTGMIKAFSISVVNGVASKVWTYTKYALVTGASSNSVVVMNPSTWNALPAYWQDVIQNQVMPQVIDYALEVGQSNEQSDLQKLKDGYASVGGLVTEMSAEATKEVGDGMRAMPEVTKYIAALGTDAASVIYDWQPH